MVLDYVAKKVVSNVIDEISPEAIIQREFPGLIKIMKGSPQQAIDEIFNHIKHEEEIKLE